MIWRIMAEPCRLLIPLMRSTPWPLNPLFQSAAFKESRVRSHHREGIGFKVSATGVNARIQPAVPSLLTGELSGDNLDAHRIQPFYAGLLAKECSVKATVTAEGETVVIAAQ